MGALLRRGPGRHCRSGFGYGTLLFIYYNRNGPFVDVTFRAGIRMDGENTISATFYDYDRDADLDLFLGHWGVERGTGDNPATLWQQQRRPHLRGRHGPSGA